MMEFKRKHFSPKLSFRHLCLKPKDIDLVIYHGGCPDGFASAFAADLYFKKFFPEKKIEYFAATSRSKPPLVQGKKVLICDFAYDEKITQTILQETKDHCIILDHHESSMKKLVNIPDRNKLFVMNYSGAYLAWKFFFPSDPVPDMIELIQDHDLWTKKLFYTDAFAAYLRTVPQNFESYGKLLKSHYLHKYVFPLGQGMVTQMKTYIQHLLKITTIKFLEIANRFYLVSHLNSTHYKSEVGEALMLNYPLCNFALVYHHKFDRQTSKEVTAISLRSQSGSTNVGNIAQHFPHGGGHPCAAGVTIPLLVSSIGVVMDVNQIYLLLLQQLDVQTMNFQAAPIKVAILESEHHRTALAKFLLQERDVIDHKVVYQEVTYFLRHKFQNQKNYNCDMSIITHFDVQQNISYFTVYRPGTEIMDISIVGQSSIQDMLDTIK